MDQLIIQESRFLLYSILLGIGITFVYDCLRIFRNVVSHSGFWISVEDLFYWIFVSFCMFFLLYYENDGMLRWFAVLGTALGMFLLKKTFSPFFIKYISKLLLFFKKILARLFSFLTKPVKMAGRAAGKKAALGGQKMRRLARILKKRLTIRLRVAKMTLCKRWKKAQRGE